MRLKTASYEKYLRSVVFVLCQFAVAITAEMCLGGFLESGTFTARTSRFFVVFLSLVVLQRFFMTALSHYRAKNWIAIIWVHISLILTIALSAVGKIIGLGLISYGEVHRSWSGISEDSIAFALPTTTFVLVVQSIFGLQFGLVISLLAALVVGTYSNQPVMSICLTLATSLVGCLSFMRVRSRSAYLRAALNIAIAGIPFAIASIGITPGSNISDHVVRVVGCLVAGFLSAFIAVGVTPVFEYLGSYASDMRLLEMATLDHPLLKELSIQAPGTWNHSMVMGMMVESAANAIHANPVVCRVGAYFHDVGKMKKPLYFVENQEPGENRHDKLSPSMSALIIRSHVKDGLELAKKHKLPSVIEDMISQHHGTSLIEYFYEKARKDAEESKGDPDSVDKGLYSYPGPRPQTREAGLLMLADVVEASARTLNDPTFDRIQGLVQKMINKIFASGELNECELTLRDLHLIAKCFTRVLTGIYHQRIAYLEPAEKVNDGETEDGEESEEGGSRPDSAKKQKGEENLRRLGVE